MLVLGWATSQLDLSVIYKILQELCLAYRTEGGRTIVVLTGREKLELEELFARTLPQEKRYGSRFVFRQGNPLKPDDLRMVGAPQASDRALSEDVAFWQAAGLGLRLPPYSDGLLPPTAVRLRDRYE